MNQGSLETALTALNCWEKKSIGHFFHHRCQLLAKGLSILTSLLCSVPISQLQIASHTEHLSHPCANLLFLVCTLKVCSSIL